MPRNSSGNYSLPLPPVVPDTVIESVHENSTNTDLGQALTDSLDRFGRGSMVAPLKIIDGSVTAPGLVFGTQPGLGMFRPNPGEMGFAVDALDRLTITAAGVRVRDSLYVGGVLSTAAGIVNRIAAGQGISLSPSTGVGTVVVTNTNIPILTGAWNWNDSLGGDPGTGNMGSNSSDFATMTQLRFSKTDADGRAYTFSTNPAGLLVIVSPDGVISGSGRFTATSPYTDFSTYVSVQVAHEAGAGNPQQANRTFVTLLMQASTGDGSVTGFFFANANGIVGDVATPNTTPTLTLTLNNITPSGVAATGQISAPLLTSSGNISAVGTVLGSNLSGTNSGDQLISASGDVNAPAGTGALVTTLLSVNGAPGDYTYASLRVDAKGRVTVASANNPVEQLLAGSGIQLSPLDGRGTVTITNDQYLAFAGHWNWSTSQAPGPAAGFMNGNAGGAPANITKFYYSKTDADGTTHPFSRSAINDLLVIVGPGGVAAEYIVESDAIDGGSYIEVAVLFIQGGTALPPDGTRLLSSVFPQTPVSNGTVTSFGFVNANGISGTVTNPTTTPALTLALGNITPARVDSAGPVVVSSADESGLRLFSTVNTVPGVPEVQFEVSHTLGAVNIGNARGSPLNLTIAGAAALTVNADRSVTVGNLSAVNIGLTGDLIITKTGPLIQTIDRTAPAGGQVARLQHDSSGLYYGYLTDDAGAWSTYQFLTRDGTWYFKVSGYNNVVLNAAGGAAFSGVGRDQLRISPNTELGGAQLRATNATDTAYAPLQFVGSKFEWFPSDSLAMTLTGTALGIGSTPNKAWGGSSRALQFTYGAFSMTNTGAIAMGFNAYNDGGQWLYMTDDQAGLFVADTDGSFTWSSASAGAQDAVVGFGSPKMTLSAVGALSTVCSGAQDQFVTFMSDAATSPYMSVGNTTGNSASLGVVGGRPFVGTWNTGVLFDLRAGSNIVATFQSDLATILAGGLFLPIDNYITWGSQVSLRGVSTGRASLNAPAGLEINAPTSTVAVEVVGQIGNYVFRAQATDASRDIFLFMGAGVSSIGTTKNVDLDFFTNNAARLTIRANGSVDMAGDLSAAKLDINSQINFLTTGLGEIVNRNGTGIRFYTNAASVIALDIAANGDSIFVGNVQVGPGLQLKRAGLDQLLLGIQAPGTGSFISSVNETNNAYSPLVVEGSTVALRCAGSVGATLGADLILRNSAGLAYLTTAYSPPQRSWLVLTTANRDLGIDYVNNAGYDIILSWTGINPNGVAGYVELYINGVKLQTSGSSVQTRMLLYATIPTGATYKIIGADSTPQATVWAEYR